MNARATPLTSSQAFAQGVANLICAPQLFVVDGGGIVSTVRVKFHEQSEEKLRTSPCSPYSLSPHLDPMNVFNIGAEPCGVVYLALEKYSSNLFRRVRRRMVMTCAR